MTRLLLIVLVMLLSACTNTPLSENIIQTAIAETQAAQPTNTRFLEATETFGPTLEPTEVATYTPRATVTRRPTSTTKPKQTGTQVVASSREEAQQMLVDSTVDALEKFSDLLGIEKLNMVRFNDVGVFQIELKTRWAAKDNQPIVSYELISFLSNAWRQMSKDTLIEISGTGSDNFYVEIVTYSTIGDDRYYSLTDYDLMNKIFKKSISYEEWVIASNAGFTR